MSFGGFLPRLVLGTPRKLPKPESLEGRVAVLDIAFAAEGTGSSFEKVTGRFLAGLGPRLCAWIDHHDHVYHPRYAKDPRFVLATKKQHGACPEMVTRERVERLGPADTLLFHDDLDGLYSAAKWALEGVEPYAGADADARAVDTRLGEPSELGALVDRALRGRPRDEGLRFDVVRWLCAGELGTRGRAVLEAAGEEFARQEARAMRLAESYRVEGPVAVVDASGFTAREGAYDKTLALLLGQRLARVAVLFDEQTVNVAAAFDSGIDLLALLGLQGGMPTRVSVPRARLEETLATLSRL